MYAIYVTLKLRDENGNHRKYANSILNIHKKLSKDMINRLFNISLEIAYFFPVKSYEKPKLNNRADERSIKGAKQAKVIYSCKKPEGYLCPGLIKPGLGTNILHRHVLVYPAYPPLADEKFPLS